jgi:hypothetical protein
MASNNDKWQSYRISIPGKGYFVRTKEGLVSPADLFGQALGHKAPVRDGKRVKTGLEATIARLKPGALHADYNAQILNTANKLYGKYLTNEQLSYMSVDMAALARKVLNKDDYTVHGFSTKNVVDPFIKTDARLKSLSDIYRQPNWKGMNVYGGIIKEHGTDLNPGEYRFIGNTAVQYVLVRDADGDRIVGIQVNQTGGKSAIAAWKFPLNIIDSGITPLASYDPQTPLRHLIGPTKETIMAGAKQMEKHINFFRTSESKESYFHQLALDQLQPSIIGTATNRLNIRDKYLANRMLEELEPDLAKQILGDPAKLAKWQGYFQPSKQTGERVETLEAILKAVKNGAIDLEAFPILRSRLARNGLTEMFQTKFKQVSNQSPEMQYQFLNALLDPASQKLGSANDDFFFDGSAHNLFFKPKKVEPLKFESLSRVEDPARGEYRGSILQSLTRAINIDPETGRKVGIIGFQGITIAEDLKRGSIAKPYALTVRDINGNLNPIVGGKPIMSKETFAILRTQIDENGVRHAPMYAAQMLEEAYDKDEILIDNVNGYGRMLGEATGLFDRERLMSRKGLRQIMEMSRVTGRSKSEIYGDLQRWDEYSQMRTHHAIMARDINKRPDIYQGMMDAVRKMVGFAGDQVQGFRADGQPVIERYQQELANAAVSIDIGYDNADPEFIAGMLDNFRKHHNLAGGITPREGTSRYLHMFQGHGPRNNPLYLDQDVIGSHKTFQKAAKQSWNTSEFEGSVAYIDFQHLDEKGKSFFSDFYNNPEGFDRVASGPSAGWGAVFDPGFSKQIKARLTSHDPSLIPHREDYAEILYLSPNGKEASTSKTLIENKYHDSKMRSVPKELAEQYSNGIFPFTAQQHFYDDEGAVKKVWSTKPIDENTKIIGPHEKIELQRKEGKAFATVGKDRFSIGMLIGYHEAADKNQTADLLRNAAINADQQGITGVMAAFHDWIDELDNKAKFGKFYDMLPKYPLEVMWKGEQITVPVPFIARDRKFHVSNLEGEGDASFYEEILENSSNPKHTFAGGETVSSIMANTNMMLEEHFGVDAYSQMHSLLGERNPELEQGKQIYSRAAYSLTGSTVENYASQLLAQGNARRQEQAGKWLGANAALASHELAPIVADLARSIINGIK